MADNIQSLQPWVQNQTRMSSFNQDYPVDLNSTSVGDLVGINHGPPYNNTWMMEESNWTHVGDPAPVGILRDIGLGVVLAFLCMLTFVGNAMVLHAVRTERRLQTVRK